MIGGARDRMKKQMAKKVLESEYGTAIISIITTMERELIEAVDEQHDLLDIDHIEQKPSQEDRTELLRELALAKIDGSFPSFWVRHCSGLENADEAAQFADRDDFEDMKKKWADRYRDAHPDEPVDSLADGHVRARYGVGLDKFEELVVEWSESREAQHLRDIMASGVETAHSGIEKSNERLRDLDVGGE